MRDYELRDQAQSRTHGSIENTTWCQRWDCSSIQLTERLISKKERRQREKSSRSSEHMVTVQYTVSPPASFNFSQPQEWPKWIRHFERFRTAAELTAKDEEAQVNMLIYTMGDKAEDILRSFKLSEADAKKYSVVKEKFEDHFIKKRNVIYERARFNSRKQEEGEPADSFITDLHGGTLRLQGST